MHVSLYVSNLEQTVAFYTTFFGQEATKLKPGYAKWLLESPPLIISFVENPEAVRPTFGHLGFQVETPGQLAEHLERLQAAGLVSREEKGIACCFAVQDKFWVADPDGHQWEVYFFHKDVEFNDPHTAADTAPCCLPLARDEKPKRQLAELGTR
jgi:catechol 2,3-dioxygenase-like lactoylglutathione lyase family enzyme